jgi:hypothetical protein
VGDEGWVAVLNRDYGRSGPVCELLISSLPEGFFLLKEDPDIMDRTNTPDSGMLISRATIIPPQCITISRVLNTEKVVEDYPDIMHEFPDEGYNITD